MLYIQLNIKYQYKSVYDMIINGSCYTNASSTRMRRCVTFELTSVNSPRDSHLSTCLISARLPRCTLIWDHLWHSNGSLSISRTKTKTIGPRGFYFASSAAWNALPVHLRDPDLSLNSFKIKLKTHFFSWRPPPGGRFTYLVSLFVARANAIIYKLARANIWIELNWIELKTRLPVA